MAFLGVTKVYRQPGTPLHILHSWIWGPLLGGTPKAPKISLRTPLTWTPSYLLGTPRSIVWNWKFNITWHPWDKTLDPELLTWHPWHLTVDPKLLTWHPWDEPEWSEYPEGPQRLDVETLDLHVSKDHAHNSEQIFRINIEFISFKITGSILHRKKST